MTHGDLLLAQPVGCDVHAEAAWFLWSRVPLKLQRSLIWGPVANARTEKLKDSELKMCVGWQQWAGVQARWVCHGQGSITGCLGFASRMCNESSRGSRAPPASGMGL